MHRLLATWRCLSAHPLTSLLLGGVTVVSGFAVWSLLQRYQVLYAVTCIVGVFVTSTIGMIAQLHVRWQIYNEYLLQGGEPIELAPWEGLTSEAAKVQR